MSEHLFIEKRQRERAREKPLVTTRRIFALVVLSLGVYGGFRVWIGNPLKDLCGENCSSMHDLSTWVLGIAILFGAIIAAGAFVGVLAALFKHRRSDSMFTHYLEEAEHSGEDRPQR